MKKIKTATNITVVLKDGNWYCGDLLVPTEILFSGKYKFKTFTTKKVVLTIKRIPKEWIPSGKKTQAKTQTKSKKTVRTKKQTQQLNSTTNILPTVKGRSSIIDPNRKIQFIDYRDVGADDRKIDKKNWKGKKPVPRIRPAAITVEKQCYVCGKTEMISSGLAATMLEGTSYRCNKCNGAK